MSDAQRSRRSSGGVLLVFSQTFVPDPASVGQHMADVAFEMARRGHRVRVYASSRGYEDASARYPRRETLHGADIRRLPMLWFGKKSIALRALGTLTFLIQCIFIGLFTPNVKGIFFSTSPPLVGMAAVIAKIFRRVPVAYWAMDLNPDQLIALGKLKPTDPAARLLAAVHRTIVSQSNVVYALDRFMARRLTKLAPGVAPRLVVLPPWPHEEHAAPLDHADNPFRRRHNLDGKFVVMYSGNHSPSNPLTTLLRAAVEFRNDPSIEFLFIGGGAGKKEVESFIHDHALANVRSLPYQPLSEIRFSLSAADVHVVSLGDAMVGIVHPCKIYGAMAVSRPVLFFGPRPSHIADLLDANPIGLHVAHGDVPAAVAAIHRLRQFAADERHRMGETARSVLSTTLSQSLLCRRFCDHLEEALSHAHG
jgi:hypothetical protein